MIHETMNLDCDHVLYKSRMLNLIKTRDFPPTDCSVKSHIFRFKVREAV